MTDQNFELTNNLKYFRKEKKLSQQDLADAVDVTRQSILMIEKNKFNPSILLSLKIAKVLGVDVNELFSITNKG
ncbi:helix-turn-helix transcriptional regulator [Companilactobacillus mishanensis]|uniref:Helix-turn-helix transcriptional regulator n=1 Tax=Companilactobacillus mishanensis TaxID=2486008 RepID=A0A5P0ZJT9_9LACO|nr:helix-turn-helix transcriptional regulator [Companilactobacillus mishanensis]MQS53360.1 helix-turn-helix transcriptional regulator [Companilactobacillus mishanensis]